MPSFLGVLNINRNEGTLINGDTAIVSPTTASKSFAGGGGGITGDFVISNTTFSATITFDPHVAEAGVNRVGTAG